MNHINPGEVIDFTREFEYFNYLQNKVYCEAELARVVYTRVVLSEAYGDNARKLIAINEAKAINKIKEIWSKFVEFVNKTGAKFLEKITKILINQQNYLKKYKEIILERVPKHIQVSYHGNYMTAVDRLLKVKIASFPDNLDDVAIDKDKNGSASDDEITASIVNHIFKKYNSTDFDKFDVGGSMADQFKSYFIGADKGDFNGYLDDNNIVKLKDMYNFCMNHKQAEDVIRADENMIKATANKIDAIWNQYTSKHPEAKKGEVPKTGGNQTGNATPVSGKGGVQTGGENNQESLFMNLRGLRYLNEEEQNNNNNNQAKNNEDKAKDAERAQENKDGDATKSDLQITSTNSNIANKAGSMNKDKEDNTEEKVKEQLDNNAQAAIDFFNKYIDKWRLVCSNILTAKLTVYQQIAKDFMNIIRAHVQSYVGSNDKDDIKNKKTEDEGIDYNKFIDGIDNNAKRFKNESKEKFIKDNIDYQLKNNSNIIDKLKDAINNGNATDEIFNRLKQAAVQLGNTAIRNNITKDKAEAVEIANSIIKGLGINHEFELKK